MKLAMKLTTDGLVRALRWKALAIGEDVTFEKQALARGAGAGTIANTGMETSSGGMDDAWSGSTAEGTV